ncbi:hypothetical protein [Brevibacterium paucivorans]|uniref:Lipoprotein n=1 Tax=Brevibacterium paucivorans TaxID=170994 RepID=A0A2N6VL51_9MICO|nr:hypothetical protein [Brevibacterium paucivorans]PMD04872.1 hypothetical protein CJ199_10990 [Brevibacterium paucivorans]
MTKRIVRSALALTCAALLAGCGSLGIRVAENDGSPVKVGVSAQKGSASNPEPTEEPVPDGFEKVTFEGDCPFEVSMVMPDDYKSTGGATGLAVYTDDFNKRDEKIVVNCKKSFGRSLNEARDSHMDYLVNKPESDVLLQNRYDVDGAAAGVFQVKLAKGEIYATSSDVQMVGTIYVGYADGALWELKVEGTSIWGDQARTKKHQTVIDHISVDGHKLKTLDWKDM